MDATSGMDFQTKMGSLLLLTTGALLGACVALYFTRRRKGRRLNDTGDDSTARLRQELRECQRKLEELSQRLEEEADRRKESDTWGRTLEKDLHDHVITRRIAEEKVSDLSGQLQDLRQRNRDSEQRNKQLSLELKLITDAASDAKDMLPDSKTLCMDSDHGNGRCNALPCAQPRLESPLSGSSGGTIHQPVGRGPGMDSKDADTYDEEYDEDNEEDYDESTDEEEEDYEEEREAGEAELELIKRSIIPRPPSDENFELGKDVMGALIAKAFKGGMLESRGRPQTEAEEAVQGRVQGASVKTSQTEDSQLKQGEVSQESIGDIKSTRRFWEQMIAADLPEEDDVSEDDVTDDDDVDGSDDYDEDGKDIDFNENTGQKNIHNDESHFNNNIDLPATNGLPRETSDPSNFDSDQSSIRAMTSQHEMPQSHCQTGLT